MSIVDGTDSAGDRDALHDEVCLRLEAQGRRFTSNHRLVIDVLADAGQPLTIPQILPRTPGVPQSSVYRTLTVLEEAGAVSRLVVGSNHAHFELSEHLGRHHHHLVCRSCGTVTDIDFTPETEAIIESALADVAGRRRFRVDEHQIDAIGFCADCA
ncbi:MAG: transcriptional repressor [Acidimicrobiia bacterium]|nr:transcriptional repressor [Acidimicrobiia bacterium]